MTRFKRVCSARVITLCHLHTSSCSVGCGFHIVYRHLYSSVWLQGWFILPHVLLAVGFTCSLFCLATGMVYTSSCSVGCRFHMFPLLSGYRDGLYRGFPTRMVYLKHDI